VRTRWLVVLAGISLAANVLFASVLIQTRWATRVPPRSASVATPTFCDEEKRLREELAGLLCAKPPDRPAIAAALARLDTLRSTHRDRALAEWFASCERANEQDRAALQDNFRHQMCPWQKDGEGCCAPSPGPGAPSEKPAQPSL
jgi:hypothetical protein